MRKIDSAAGRAVPRARPLAGYIGGKWFLRGTICPLIDADHHRCYVEAFLGMGNVFMGRTRRPPIEVINDKSDQVATLFRVVQRHPDELTRALRHQLTSRSEYARLLAIDPAALTDIERSARFLVLRRLTFANKDPYPAGFAFCRVSPHLFDAAEVMRRLEALHQRLNRVVIEQLDFERVLSGYDTPNTFFYLDPPYWGSTHLYREAGFAQADFARLKAALGRLKGRWLMSLNDHPGVRGLFADCQLRRVHTRYSGQSGRGSTRVTELLISPR